MYVLSPFGPSSSSTFRYRRGRWGIDRWGIRGVSDGTRPSSSAPRDGLEGGRVIGVEVGCLR